MKTLTKGQTTTKRRKWGVGEIRKHAAFATMLLPGTLFLLVFNYLPMPGILLAFKKFKLSMPTDSDFFQNAFINSFIKSEWVGFKNFEFLFKTPDAGMITRNTVLYNLAFIILGLITSVLLAIAINELIQRRMAKVYQTIFFFPYFLSWIVVSYLLYTLLSTQHGVFNRILETMGRDPIQWYAEPKYWPFIMVFANLWKYTGNGSIIYLATITGLDPQLYEAAAIDGASKFQQIMKITLPQLVPIMVLLSILAVGRIFYGDFAMFYSLPNGSGQLRNVTTVIDVYVYNTFTTAGARPGLPTAAGLYQSVVGLIMILSTNLLVRKIDSNMALF